MSQRLTRKEMKRDQVAERIGSVLEYVVDNQRTIWLALGALIAAILVGVGVRSYLDGRAEQAGGELAKAIRVFGAPIDREAATPDDPEAPSFPDEASRAERAAALFSQVEERFGSSDAADVARVYRAGLLARDGDLEGARALWEAFLDRQSDHMLAKEVRVNLMALEREQGRGEALAEELRAMLDGGASTIPEDILLYQLALTFEKLGRDADAMDALQRILDDFPQSAYGAAARRRGARSAGAAA